MNVQIQKLLKYNIKKFIIVLNFFNCIHVFLSTIIVSYFICFILFLFHLYFYEAAAKEQLLAEAVNLKKNK